MLLLKIIVALGILYLLYLMVRPYRDPFVSRTTKSLNGRAYGKERDLY